MKIREILVLCAFTLLASVAFAQEVTTDISSPFVYCGLAETPADCPASVSGKIALIARGSTYTTPALPAASSAQSWISARA